jgi:DNA-binding CsgD family transcriptional regulator
LAYLAQGRATKEIAGLLGISLNGVKKHLDTLHRHYGVTNRVALIIAAIEAGDVELRVRSGTAAARL